jgi:hypothetical protein
MFRSGAIQASDLTGRDDKHGDDTVEQDATPKQIIATQPTVDMFGEAKLDEADDVAMTGPNGSDDVPVGAFTPVTKTRWRQIGAGVTTSRLWTTRLSRRFLAPWRQNDLVLGHDIHAPLIPLELW